MKTKLRKIVLFVLAIVLAVVGVLLLQKVDYRGYSILFFICAIVLLIVGIRLTITESDPNRAYESKVKMILTTYDSVLVKSGGVPQLGNRNIIWVESMEDLIDAQLEIRKPICYLKQSESCSFVLLDDKEAYIYIEKLNEEVVSPVEIEISEAKIRHKSAQEMDSEMLREIDKTTIVKLSNRKSYKISPIRKVEEPEKVTAIPEIVDGSKLRKQQWSSDEIETLEQTLILPKAGIPAELEEVSQLSKTDEIEIL